MPFSFALKTDDDCFVDLENILQVSKFYQLHFVGRQRSRVYKRASQTVAIRYAENWHTLQPQAVAIRYAENKHTL